VKVFFTNSFFFNFFLFFPIQASAVISSESWAWLYCVSPHVSYAKKQPFHNGYPWQYALYKNSERLNPYKQFVYPWYSVSYPTGGIVIHSKGDKEVFNSHPLIQRNVVYAIVDHEFQNIQEAKQFCEALQKKCEDDHLYRDAVGYGYSNSTWKGIRAETKNGEGVNCKSRFPKNN
jgi:hypothetical protein